MSKAYKEKLGTNSMAAYIYKIKNMLDGKEYIGKSEREDIEDRWGEHRREYRYEKLGCPCLYRAMQKHGLENFSFQIVCICFNEDVDDLETYYIQKYNTLVPNGYNLATGGDGGRLHEETKKKISRAKKGQKPWNTGKEWSADVKEKFSKAKLGKLGKDHNKAKPILQYLKGGEFIQEWGSVSDAARHLGNVKYACNIGGCALGKCKTAYGFIWKYPPPE